LPTGSAHGKAVAAGLYRYLFSSVFFVSGRREKHHANRCSSIGICIKAEKTIALHGK